MGRIVEVRVTGLRETIDRIKKLEQKLITKDTRKAVREGLVPIHREARSNLVPHILTGELYDSVRISTRYRAGDTTVKGSVSHASATFYGKFLEFGTRRQTGVRWMGRAFDAMGGSSIIAFGDSLRRSLQEPFPK